MYKWFTIIIISSRGLQKKYKMAIVTINDMRI